MQTLQQDEKAFFFYTKLDSPTGQKARDLKEFAELLKQVDPSSVAFHLTRGDFEKWLASTVQDRTLVTRIASLRREKLSPLNQKKKLVKIVDKSVKRFQ